jgi:Taurine catabolism dioxygenase TauD, TfdA family
MSRSALDWCGDQIADGTDWRLPLSGVHQTEVLAALAAARAAGVGPDEASPELFPLPTLGPRLARLASGVAHGRGFALVQAVPVAGLTEEEVVLLAVGMAVHVGELVPQGPQNAPVMHVRDEGIPRAARSYQHRRGLGFHADPTDVVALLCLRPASAGGLSTIVSAVAVHNAFVDVRPDLARTLYEPWWFDNSADRPGQRPLYFDGGLRTNYAPDHLRSERVPPLSARQAEAFDLLDRLTSDPPLPLTMDLRAGDLQLLNNHVVLHRRTAFQDRRRHLLRLWLNLR